MATMGRLMKNFDIRLPRLGLHSKRLGIYLRACAHLLNSFGNDSLPLIQAADNDPSITDTVAGRDCPNVHFVLAIYNSDLIAALELRHCALRNKQCAMLN